VLSLLLAWFLNNVARNSLVAISGFEMWSLVFCGFLGAY